MKKIAVALLAAVIGLPVWGQRQSAAPDVSPSIRVSTAVQTPQSNIDLLKKSLQTSSSVAGVATGASTAPAVNQPAAAAPKPAAASTTTAIAAPKAVLPANTLDMPLEMDGTVKSVQTTVAPAAKAVSATAKQPVKPTELEKDIEKSNALLPKSSQQQADTAAETATEDAAADAELEYAVKMLEKSKEAIQTVGRKIPPSAAQNRPATVPAPNKKFNPNAYRPGVTWVPSKSTHFDIYTQKRTSGISSSNMAMTFESAYQTLRRFIPWMMSNRVRVFVYQDYQSYLRHEPNAKAWTRALAYPTRGEIVVYDEPGKNQELKEVFTHELTHIFTQQFFDSHKTGRIMTPTWLDEGLAVLMEDQAYNGLKGGPWNNDFKTLNFQRDPSTEVATFGSSSMFGSAKKLTSKRPGKPLYLVPFAEFMQEGSLSTAEGQGKTQDWYFQAYVMVRFLLNPAGGASPSNRMQFEQFTRLLSQGEAVRNPTTGFLQKDSRGKTVYQPYSVEKALGRAYRYNTIANFEDNFWRWADK